MKRTTTIISLTMLISNGVLADIYRFTDNKGHVHYTNFKPHQSGYKRIVESKLPRYSYREGVLSGKFKPYQGGYKPNLGSKLSRYSYSTGSFSGSPFLTGKKSKFADLINQAANKHNVDPRLVHAVIQTESAYNAGAISSAGAVGLMQLMPDTARRYGVTDRSNPDQNVDGGTRYLKDLIKMFTPNLDLAVAAYNAGENAVIKYHYSIPPYPETQNYVKQVLSLYSRMTL